MKTLLAEVFVEVLTGAAQHYVSEKTSLIEERNLSQIKEINSVKNGRNPLKKTALCAAGAYIKPLKTNSI